MCFSHRTCPSAFVKYAKETFETEGALEENKVHEAIRGSYFITVIKCVFVRSFVRVFVLFVLFFSFVFRVLSLPTSQINVTL